MLMVAELVRLTAAMNEEITENRICELFLISWMRGNPAVFRTPDVTCDFSATEIAFIEMFPPHGMPLGPGQEHRLIVHDQNRSSFFCRLITHDCLPSGINWQKKMAQVSAFANEAREKKIKVKNHTSPDPFPEIVTLLIDTIENKKLHPTFYDLIKQFVVTEFLAVRFLLENDLPIPSELKSHTQRIFGSSFSSPNPRRGKKKGAPILTARCCDYFDFLINTMQIKLVNGGAPKVARLMHQFFPELSELSTTAIAGNIRRYHDERISRPERWAKNNPHPTNNPLK